MNLYESEKFSSVTGPTLRPGGLALTQTMLDFCTLAPNSMVLDIGCGQGATLTLLEQLGHCPYGVDISASLLFKAMDAAPKAVVAKASAEKTPFNDIFFDAAFGECVMSLMDNPELMLKEAYRVLKPNGALCLTDIYIRELRQSADYGADDFKSCLKGAMELDRVKTLVENANFEITHISDHTDKLKQLTAELIFAYGSLKDFWGFFVGSRQAESICACNHKFGYYMLIAHKKEE